MPHADPGFRPQNVLVADVFLNAENYPDAARMIRSYRDALAAARALPGVASVGVIAHLPFSGNTWGNSYGVEGQPQPPGVELTAQMRPISPGYFATMQIPLKQGRDFTEHDNETAPGVAIVNEMFARRHWRDENPIGKRIRYGRDWISIVGVCGSVKHNSLDSEPYAEIYVPYPQTSVDALTFVGRQLNFVVRSSAPASVAPSIRNTIHSLDPALVVKVNTMESLINDSVAQPRFYMVLLAAFAGIAVLLAALGIYGVISYSVGQRTRELGIRVALGATQKKIVRLVVASPVHSSTPGVVTETEAAALPSWLSLPICSRPRATLVSPR